MTRLLSIAALIFVFFSASAQGPARDARGDSVAAPTMEQMQQQMQVMRQQMDRMHSTTSAEEHQTLMQEHMQSLNTGMTMMGRMMGAGSMSQGHARGGQMSQCREGDEQCQMTEMQAHQHMMGEQMGLMQQMMQQMMGHMMEMQRHDGGTGEDAN